MTKVTLPCLWSVSWDRIVHARTMVRREPRKTILRGEVSYGFTNGILRIGIDPFRGKVKNRRNFDMNWFLLKVLSSYSLPLVESWSRSLTEIWWSSMIDKVCLLSRQFESDMIDFCVMPWIEKSVEWVASSRQLPLPGPSKWGDVYISLHVFLKLIRFLFTVTLYYIILRGALIEEK